MSGYEVDAAVEKIATEYPNFISNGGVCSPPYRYYVIHDQHTFNNNTTIGGSVWSFLGQSEPAQYSA
jgi:hypothetical protein